MIFPRIIEFFLNKVARIELSLASSCLRAYPLFQYFQVFKVEKP